MRQSAETLTASLPKNRRTALLLGGAGTVPVEAIYAGRDAIGIEPDARLVEISRARITQIDRRNVGHAAVIWADPRYASRLHTDPAIRAQAALLLLDARPPSGTGSRAIVHIGDYSLDQRLARITDTLAACEPLLRPGAVIVVLARTYCQAGVLIDFPSFLLNATENTTALEPLENCVILAHPANVATPVELARVRRMRTAGLLVHLPAHADVLVLRAPGEPHDGFASLTSFPPADNTAA